MQLLVGLCHERTAVGDFRQRVNVRLVQQQFGHDEIVEFGFTQRHETVEGQCANECRIAEGHHALEFLRFDPAVVEGIEECPGDDLRGEERPATERQHRGGKQRGRCRQQQPGRLVVFGHTFDQQARAQGDGEDEHQVQPLEIPGAAGKQQNDDQDREDTNEHQ
ncbi:hypothetical protein D9M71_713220 [compost metagenome]